MEAAASLSMNLRQAGALDLTSDLLRAAFHPIRGVIFSGVP